MPNKMKNIDFGKFFIYVGFGLVNILVWLFLMGISFFMMTSCTTSKPQEPTPSLEELKERFADKDTVTDSVPVAISIPADSATITIIPDLLPVDMPVSSGSKNGGLQLTATRRKDNSLDIVALQKPDTVLDTVERRVPVVIFNECKVKAHISQEEAEKLAAEKLEEYKKANELTTREVMGYLKWLLILLLLIVAIRFLNNFFKP